MTAPRIDFEQDGPAPHPDFILTVADPHEAIRLGYAMATAYRDGYLAALALAAEAHQKLEREREARYRLIDELRTCRQQRRAS